VVHLEVRDGETAGWLALGETVVVVVEQLCQDSKCQHSSSQGKRCQQHKQPHELGVSSENLIKYKKNTTTQEE
jgi:hypothetical protein